MTDVKIPSIPLESGAVESVKAVGESLSEVSQADGAEAVHDAGMDTIDRIAEAVAAGEIGQAEAVERILADVLSSPMVANAPEGLREEIDRMLRNLIEDDPHLRALRSAISPSEIE